MGNNRPGQDFGGKDRAKHDGGKDASGQVPEHRKHPDSPGSIQAQPESGTERDENEERVQRQRSTNDDDI